MSILYITQNGITTHIGGSQVAPYLLGLARSGHDITLLSAEPEGQEKLISHYEGLFSEVGIRWKQVRYQNKPAILGPVLTQLRLSNAARRIVSNGGIKIVHCRSHPTAVIGYRLKQRYGVKFIFDFRDFYADWGLQNTRGIKRLLYKQMKRYEGPMICEADKVICLTNRAACVLKDTFLSTQIEAAKQFKVIPCCADFSHFDLSKLSSSTIATMRNNLAIPEGAFVLLYLGSLGTDYLLKEMISLFRQLLQIQPEAFFLFVSNSSEDLVRLECEHQGVLADRVRFTTTCRDSIPAHIALADISVVFIRSDHTKVGCSPTKLAELFACNVPVIGNSGVGDMDTIINLATNGSVLVQNFSDAALYEALETVISYKTLNKKAISIRENSRMFALEQGVTLYSQVYRELLNP